MAPAGAFPLARSHSRTAAHVTTKARLACAASGEWLATTDCRSRIDAHWDIEVRNL
jgi:hypothetical protein